MLPNEILYIYGDFDWVLLLGIWGAVGYPPLLILRQYRSRQFVPATQGLAQSEFSYKGDSYKKEDLRDVQCLELDSTDEEIGSRSDDNSCVY
ncbi:hypothetical protein Goari_022878 [Gossypium aridum]|uniref:Uncharacterized protein n=1 Tax=Gossypium aridum TaxID=34290 RepID=A0A7J8YLN1_GOSAI|nr:hypothetical protein [Gossypium aridum]